MTFEEWGEQKKIDVIHDGLSIYADWKADREQQAGEIAECQGLCKSHEGELADLQVAHNRALGSLVDLQAEIALLKAKDTLLAAPIRALLDWFMCSDPWPGGDHEAVESWLNYVCRDMGFETWVDAYHAPALRPTEEE
jgi:hypothetical protein